MMASRWPVFFLYEDSKSGPAQLAQSTTAQDPEPLSLNRKPKPLTRNSSLRSSAKKSYPDKSTKSSTQMAQTVNPKPEALNPKRETLNPIPHPKSNKAPREKLRLFYSSAERRTALVRNLESLRSSIVLF